MKYKIVTYNDDLRNKIIEFLKSVTIDEFGFKEWKDYLENKDFSPYKTEHSKFMIVLDGDNIIATIGGLQVDDYTIKLNSFYVKREYRYQGIGKELYNRLIDFSIKMNYKYMILCTYDEYDICWSGSMGVLYVILMLVYNSISQDPDNKVMVFFTGVVGIIMLIIHFMQSMKLARSFGKGRLYGVFLFFFGGIARIILGLGDAEYIGRVG